MATACVHPSLVLNISSERYTCAEHTPITKSDRASPAGHGPHQGQAGTWGRDVGQAAAPAPPSPVRRGSSCHGDHLCEPWPQALEALTETTCSVSFLFHCFLRLCHFWKCQALPWRRHSDLTMRSLNLLLNLPDFQTLEERLRQLGLMDSSAPSSQGTSPSGSGSPPTAPSGHPGAAASHQGGI